MSIKRKIKKRRSLRKFRTRAKVKKTGLMRVSVFRSLSNIYAQLIDDVGHCTIASFSSLQLQKNSDDKKERARKVGLELAKLALQKGVNEAVFDRGSYLYHGRVKYLAEGLREGGLRI